MDPEPKPTDGPDYHADHKAWQQRQADEKRTLRPKCGWAADVEAKEG